MSFPQDLDEIPTRALRTEILRRKALRDMGLCDYCGRSRVITPACKFPARHNLKAKKPVVLKLTCTHYTDPNRECSRCENKNCAPCSLCFNCQPKKVKKS